MAFNGVSIGATAYEGVEIASWRLPLRISNIQSVKKRFRSKKQCPAKRKPPRLNSVYRVPRIFSLF